MSDASEQRTAHVDDHPFEPRTRNGWQYWWDLCAVCNLSQAAHAQQGVFGSHNPISVQRRDDRDE